MTMDHIPLPEHEKCCYGNCTERPVWGRRTYLKRFLVWVDLCDQHNNILNRIKEIDRIMGDEL